MLVGDLNFHLDIKDYPDAIKFLDLIDSCGLKILECGNDFKTMFSIIGEILQKKKSSKPPDHDSPVDLANQFAHITSCLR